MVFTATEFVSLTEKTMLYLIVLDKDGNVHHANKRSEHLFQLSKIQISGKSMFEFLIDTDKEKLAKIISQPSGNKTIIGYSFRFPSPKNLSLITIKFDFIHHNNLIYASGIDITEENKENSSLTSLTRLNKAGTWYYNPIAEKMFFSKECYELHELEIETPITLEKAVSYYHPDSKKNALSQLRSIITKQKSVDYTEKIITEKGNAKWIRVLAEPIIHNDNVIFINGSFADVTERYDYLEKLRNNQITKQLALKGIRSGLFDHRFDTNTTFYSVDFKKMVGLPLDDDFVPLNRFNDLIHSDDIEAAKKRHINALKKKGNNYFNYFRIINKHGAYIHYEVHGHQEKNKKGVTIRMIGNLINVHQKKLNEQIIFEKQSKLSVMVDNSFAYTLLLDTTGKILMADKGTLRIIKRDYNINPIDTPTLFINTMAVNFRDTFTSSFNKAMEGKVVKEELKRITSKGALQWLETKYIPIFDKKNQIDSVFISFHDITKLKIAQQTAKAVHQKEQELSNLKSNILSNFSHEIRTPLNGIMTISNLLLAGEEKPEEREQLLIYLEESKDRLLKTITNLSNFSEIETIKKNLEYKEADINYEIENSYREFRHIAKSKNLAYILELDKNCPKGIIDVNIFNTAISNIINNAIKYTNKGKITVQIKAMPEEKSIYIKIMDTGIGIDNKNLEKIFDPFVQESIGLSRKYEGTGIGLSLSKKYIEILDGHIEIKSELNKGTEFIIVIPQSL